MKCDKVEKLISELKSRPTSLQKKNELIELPTYLLLPVDELYFETPLF